MKREMRILEHHQAPCVESGNTMGEPYSAVCRNIAHSSYAIITISSFFFWARIPSKESRFSPAWRESQTCNIPCRFLSDVRIYKWKYAMILKKRRPLEKVFHGFVCPAQLDYFRFTQALFDVWPARYRTVRTKRFLQSPRLELCRSRRRAQALAISNRPHSMNAACAQCARVHAA